MKHYLKLVPISAKIHRKQSKMTRICITLAVFLVAVMFGLADMYLQGVTRQLLQESANWHYQFTSLDEQTANLISARIDVETAGWHIAMDSSAGYTIHERSVAVSAQDESVFEKIFLGKIAEGEYPDTENEIAVSSSVKDIESLSLNEKIGISNSDGKTMNYTIVGFLDDTEISRLGIGSEQFVVAMTPEGLDAISTPTNPVTQTFIVQFSRFCNIPDAIADIKTQNHLSEEQVTENISLLSIEGQYDGETSVNQIYQVALILSVIVMITCILMISSSLNSNVAQRTEFFGMLRCLGASKKQVMRFVRYEGLYWCKTAIPVGILASVLVVWLLCAVMRSISTHWFAYMPRFGVSWVSIIAGALLGLATVLLAARSPAKRAAKVSPLAAVSGNAGRTAVFRKAANTRHYKIETALGIHHAKARKKNYILMTGAFAVCITLFLTFTTLIDFMENAFVPPEYTPELSIASETNTCSIETELLEKVKENSAVKRAYGRMFAYDVAAEMNGSYHNANVISYEENQFRWAADSLISGSIDPVIQQENQVLVVQRENTNIQIGDSITLSINDQLSSVTVAGILSDSPLARNKGTETIFCSEKTFTALTGETGYTIIDVQFLESASDEDVIEIEHIFTNGGVTFTDQLSQIQQQRNLYRAFSVLVYGFLSIIVAITIFHIMNTISMGVSAKMKEYGVMRAIGMSNQQLSQMVIAEAGTYAVSGMIVGCIIGLPMHWVIFVSLITNIWGIAWSIPVVPLILIIGVVFVASLLAVRGPVKSLRQMSIVDNINTQ